jgi:hypothetical protein
VIILFPEELREHAVRIANELYDELKAGRLKAVGLDQIEPRCQALKLSPMQTDDLITQTCRKVVEFSTRKL